MTIGGYAVYTHPGREGQPVVYLATRPLTVGSPDGSVRRITEGDLLRAAEIQEAGTAVARMVRMGELVPLPAASIVSLSALALDEPGLSATPSGSPVTRLTLTG